MTTDQDSRVATLVFTDLVDSTRLKTQFGDRRAGELISRHQQLVQRLAAELGGREVDSAGDGFFLTFDTPSAATRFGLLLQLEHAQDRDLPEVRVGIHMGEVSERAAPPGASKPTLVEGLAVDLAARVQGLALPGQVLLSAAVFTSARQRVREDSFERPLTWLTHGAYLFRGIEDPIQIGEVGFPDISPLGVPPDSEKARRAPDTQAAPRSRADRLESALQALADRSAPVPPEGTPDLAVGRESELAALHHHLDEASAGRGSLVCLSGEPGLGKTTLLDTFLRKAGSECALLTLSGRCSERLAGSEGFLAILEALELLVQRLGDPIAEVLELTAPTWYVEVVPQDRPGSDEAIREEARSRSAERMKRELAEFLRQLTVVAPVVLVVEDLHWGDVSTVDLLAHLANRAREMPLLLLVTYRAEDLVRAGNQFDEIRLELTARGMCHQIDLGFLSGQDIASYLQARLGGSVGPEVVDLIQSRSEGNPLFAVNLLRDLQEADLLTRAGRGWTLTRPASEIRAELPESLQSLIQRKVDRLEDEDQRLLCVASVQGADFDSFVVSRVLDADPEYVEDRLKVLEDSYSFVESHGETEFRNGELTTRYRFVHILYQNVLFLSVPARRRSSWSRSAAEALAQCHGEENDAVAAGLAYLLEEGRDFARASDEFVRAARHAHALAAQREAIGLLTRAIECGERLEGDDRSRRILEAATLRGRIRGGMTLNEEAAADFGLAARAAEELGDRSAQINAYCGRAISFVFGYRLSDAREAGERALSLARGLNSEVELASAEAVVASERAAAGDPKRALELWRRSAPILEARSPLPDSLRAIGLYCNALVWNLDYDRASSTIGWVKQQADATGSVFASIQCMWTLALSLGNQGRLGDALSLVREALRMCDLHGDGGFYTGRLANTEGWLFREMLDLEAALKRDEESVSYCIGIGDPHAEANARINAAYDRTSLGDLHAAREHLERTDEILEQRVWFYWRFNLRYQVESTRYWIAREDLVRAREHAQRGLDAASEVDHFKYVACSRQMLAEIARKEGRVEESRQHLDSALAVLGTHDCPTILWRVLRTAADLAGELRDDALRSEYLGRSEAVRHSLAESLKDEALGRLLLER